MFLFINFNCSEFLLVFRTTGVSDNKLSAKDGQKVITIRDKTTTFIFMSCKLLLFFRK